MSAEELQRQTVKLGFVNVLDAFHMVNGSELPLRFFHDERRSSGGIRLTVFGVLFQKINGVSYLISESFVMLNRNLPSPGIALFFLRD